MKMNSETLIVWFLRIALSAGFLSAVADRFGLWPADVMVWGNWDNFVAYTHQLVPFVSRSLANLGAWGATVLEIVFALGILFNYKTRWFALGGGFLTLIFALSMTFSLGIKPPLDYSAFAASAGGFALFALLSRRRKR